MIHLGPSIVPALFVEGCSFLHVAQASLVSVVMPVYTTMVDLPVKSEVESCGSSCSVGTIQGPLHSALSVGLLCNTYRKGSGTSVGCVDECGASLSSQQQIAVL